MKQTRDRPDGRRAWAGDSRAETAVACRFDPVRSELPQAIPELARAAVDFARRHGARAVEGYPMTTNVVLDELHVGTESTFAAAGFTEVSRPSPRRVVMRIDF
jgi:hypothetical protein